MYTHSALSIGSCGPSVLQSRPSSLSRTKVILPKLCSICHNSCLTWISLGLQIGIFRFLTLL